MMPAEERLTEAQIIERQGLTIRRLTAERDAAQKAMSYCSNEAHLEWTRAEKHKAAFERLTAAAAHDIAGLTRQRDDLAARAERAEKELADLVAGLETRKK